MRVISKPYEHRDICTKIIDMITEQDEQNREAVSIELDEAEWESFTQSMRQLDLAHGTTFTNCKFFGVNIKKGEKPMIKSFHQRPPEAVHTYLALTECSKGVMIEALDSDGNPIGIICTINKDGLHLSGGFDGQGAGIATDKKNRVKVWTIKGDRMRSGHLNGKSL